MVGALPTPAERDSFVSCPEWRGNGDNSLKTCGYAAVFLALLRTLEEQGQLYTVKRIAIVCGLIMRFSVATGHADIDPLPSLRGSLKTHKTKHLASTTDPKKVGRLLRAIDTYAGSFVVSCALKIAPYVFVRPGELQHARWEDIDLEACEWRYTTSKTGTPHIVPLAPQVMAILKELHPFTGHHKSLLPKLQV